MVIKIDADTWRKRWEKLRVKYKAVVAENERLRTALDELNEDVEVLLADATQSGIEAAKSHTIRSQMASIRRLKATIRDMRKDELFPGTRDALDRLTIR